MYLYTQCNKVYLGPWKNSRLELIHNHNKPLLTCYLKQIYFGVFLSCIVKSIGPQLWLAAVLTPKVAGTIYCAFRLICASLASARLITWIHSHVPPWYQSGLRPIGSEYEKSKNDRANQWLRYPVWLKHSHWLAEQNSRNYDVSYRLKRTDVR